MYNIIKDVTTDINDAPFVSATSRLCIKLKMWIWAVLNLPHLTTHLRGHLLCNPSMTASYLAQMRSITSSDALLCVGNVMPPASHASR